MKKFVLILICLVYFTRFYGGEHKLRLGTGASYLFIDQLLGERSFGPHGSVEIVYPLSSKQKIMNAEISLGTVYHYFPGNGSTNRQILRFGFGIRVHFNKWQKVRPYFDHQVHSAILSLLGVEGKEKSYLIKLGLGLDFPLHPDAVHESDSIFIDFSYNFADISGFNAEDIPQKFFTINTGYSILF